MANFSESYDKGSKVEDFISDVLEEIFNWKFVAGSKQGKIVNTQYIEYAFSCKYLTAGRYEDGYHGPRLEFENGEIAIMPDLLFLSSHDDNFWVESKASYNPKYNSIDIEVNKLKSYKVIQNHSSKTVWLVLSVIDMEYSTCRLYSTNIGKLFRYASKNNLVQFRNSYGTMVYRFGLDKRLFTDIMGKNLAFE